MGRFIERWWPAFTTSIFALFFHLLIMPTYSYIIIRNTANIISVSSTLASVLLSFVGVIIGVVASIQHSTLMKALKSTEAYQLLKEYIRVSFVICILTLLWSITLIFILPNELFLIPWLPIEALGVLIIGMITTSARMIIILFELSGLNHSGNDKNNLWNEKPYSPDHV